MMDNEERLNELETRLAFQDDLLETLNRIVADQQQELMQLKTLCRDLLEQLQSSPAAEKRRPEDDIPPHY